MRRFSAAATAFTNITKKIPVRLPPPDTFALSSNIPKASPQAVTIPLTFHEHTPILQELKERFSNIKPPKNVTEDNFINISSQIISVLRNKDLVIDMLKDLDQTIGRYMAEAGISADELKVAPQYLITGYGCYFPGPPPEEHHVHDKLHDIFNKALLECERKFGINKEYDAIKFVGFVDPEAANKLVREGNVFTDDVQVGGLLAHGEYSHRIQMLIVLNAASRGLIDLTMDDKKTTLKPKGLLGLLVHDGQNSNPHTMWNAVFDNDTDMFGAGSITSPNSFQFSFRSTNIVQGTLTCFGSDLGLPHLQHCLLGLYWQEAEKIAQYAEEKIPNTKNLSYSEKYYLTIPRVAMHEYGPSYIGSSPFSKDPWERIDQLLAEGYKTLFSNKEGTIVVKPRSDVSTTDTKKLTQPKGLQQ